MQLFLDTDVILDLLTRREPHFAAAARLFQHIQDGEFQAVTSPVVFVNAHYLLRKARGKAEAIRLLQKLRMLVGVLPVSERVIDLALASDFSDYEDAVQYYTALESGMQTLITRNTDDYKTANLKVFTPAEFLIMYLSGGFSKLH